MLGAGLFAANLSTTFRLRKFGMTDGATFPLMFQVSSLSACHSRPFQPSCCRVVLTGSGHSMRKADMWDPHHLSTAV